MKKIVDIDLERIIVDPAFNVRAGIDPGLVARYAENLDALPPVTVFETDDGYLLTDGFHRTAAAKQLGRTEIKADVRQGDRTQAMESALQANLEHGQPLTATERRQAITGWLKLHPEWANNRIAKVFGVSANTVESVRQTAETNDEIEVMSSLVGADGKSYPRKTGPHQQPDQPEATSPINGTDPIYGNTGENSDLLPLMQEGLSDAGPGSQIENLTEWPEDGDNGRSRLQQWPDIPAPETVELTDVLLAQGNAIYIPLPDESVHTVAFSPPYWALRRYAGDEQVFTWPGMTYAMPGGEITLPGDTGCDHQWSTVVQPPRQGSMGNKSTLGGGKTQQVAARLSNPPAYNPNFGERPSKQALSEQMAKQTGQPSESDVCLKCGAIRCGLGMEPDPDMFIGHLLLILREVRRVLRKDGTLWLNLGFSYTASRGKQVDGTKQPAGVYKNKDLVAIPWLIAIAAQYDGWYLRSPIVWSKANSMPSSVTDRPSQDYEHILLLSKAEKYFYDNHALREPLNEKYAQRRLTPRTEHPKFVSSPHSQPGYQIRTEPTPAGHPAGRNKRTSWDALTETGRLAEQMAEAGYDLTDSLAWLLADTLTRYEGGEGLPEALRASAGQSPEDTVSESDSLWRVNTTPYKGAHYATWPPALAARMVQAGAAPAVCAKCGTPYERVVERSIATHQAGDDPTMDTGRAGFNRNRPGETDTRILTVPQAEISAYIKSAANGRTAECRERYGTKWDHWIRTDDSGARLPRPEDWVDLKDFLGLDDRFDADLLPYGGKQVEIMKMSNEFNLARKGRTSTEIRAEWENNPGYSDLGWRAGCTCFDHAVTPADFLDHTEPHPVCVECGEAHTKPAIVLDVTAGSGTTVQVARQLGRRGIGLDISGTYLAGQARRRVMKSTKIQQRPDTPAVIWRQPLPRNEVIHGDITDVLPRLPRASVDLMFLDPPFNIGKKYGAKVDDSLPDSYYAEYLRFWLDLCVPLLKPTGSLVLYHIPQWGYRAAAHLDSAGMYFRGWVARQAGQHNYANRPQFEPEHYPFLWFSRSEEFTFNKIRVPHKRCARCGDYSTHWGGKEKWRNEDGKFAPDVWGDLPNPRQKSKVRGANELPLEAVLRWVLSLTNPGDYVFDPFLGSGTTAAASELSGRTWGGVELVQENLAYIRLKQMIGRGAGTIIGEKADNLPAETRHALGVDMGKTWGQADVDAPDDDLVEAGRNAAQARIEGVAKGVAIDVA